MILREQHVRTSFNTPEWSVSFDHQIVLLKILSVLELSGPLEWKLNFLWRPKLLKSTDRKGGEAKKSLRITQNK